MGYSVIFFYTNGLPKYFVKLIYIRFSFKQWFSVIKFSHNASNTPNIHSCGITRMKEYLWSPIPQCYHLKQKQKIKKKLKFVAEMIIISLTQL